jgi:hypothetical protein
VRSSCETEWAEEIAEEIGEEIGERAKKGREVKREDNA